VFGELDHLARLEMPLLAYVLDQFAPDDATKLRAQIEALDAKSGADASGLDRTIPKLLDQAMHQMNAGDLDGAARSFEDLIAIGEREIGKAPRVAEWYRSAGVLAQTRGHLDRAYDWYTRAFAVWTEFATKTVDVVNTHGYMARVLWELGRYPEAVVH